MKWYNIITETKGVKQMKVMYIRVSTEEQHEDRQLKEAVELGIEKTFIEKASGKNRDRKELENMLAFVREGDTVYCSDISRIARNTKDLLNIIEELKEKKVNFISLKENIDTTTATGQFMLTVFGALYTLERENILSRQAEGIAIAKAKGNVYKGRKPKEIDRNKFNKACDEWHKGMRSATSIMKEFNLSSPTFYRKVNEWGLNK